MKSAITQEQIYAVEKMAYVEPEIVRGAMARVPPSWNLQTPEYRSTWWTTTRQF